MLKFTIGFVMAAITIDKLKFVESLKKAGVSHEAELAKK
jgi:hypothetical protein